MKTLTQEAIDDQITAARVRIAAADVRAAYYRGHNDGVKHAMNVLEKRPCDCQWCKDEQAAKREGGK